jgi:hypothetical protein
MSLPPWIQPSTISPAYDNPTWDAIIGLQPWQVWYNGQVFGLASNGVQWKEIDGLDIENIRTGDSGQPRDAGEFAGYDFLAGRDLTFKFDVSSGGDPGGTLQQNMQRLSSAFRPQQANIETPLYFNLPGYIWGTTIFGDSHILGCMVRPRNRSWKVDYTFSLGKLAQDCQVMVHATDPRFYAFPTIEQVVYYGIDDPLENAGNTDCKPLIYLYGPSTNPGITDGSNHLGWTGYTIGAAGAGWDGQDEYLLADCYYQTVLDYCAPIQSGRNITDAVAVTGMRLLTSATAAFTVSDIGKLISDAGGSNVIPLGATIVSVDEVDGIACTMSAAALGNATGDHVMIGGIIPTQPRPFAYALTAGSQWPIMQPETAVNWHVDGGSGAYAQVYWTNAWLL